MGDISSSNPFLGEIAIIVIGGLILAIITAVVTGLIKAFKNKSNQKNAKAVECVKYLSKQPNPHKDICWGREKLINKIFNIIKGASIAPYVGNHVAIIGQEGIGKTLLCQTLFNNQIRYAKVYTGWVKCNGGQSIFEIISKHFTDSRFKKNNEEYLITAFQSLDMPCVLFIDQINQHTSLNDLEKLSLCPNVTLIMSGLLKNIPIVHKDNHIPIPPLSDEHIRDIFELKSGEYIDMMEAKERKAVNNLIKLYIKGNPFLATAIAKINNGDSWPKVLENVQSREYMEEHTYIRDILKQVYRINELKADEKAALSKLAVFSSNKYVEEVFEWCNISIDCINRLSKTHWLEQENAVLFSFDTTRKEVILKTIGLTNNIKEVLASVTIQLKMWEANEDRGFRWIAPYIEDILIKIKGYYSALIESTDLFPEFTYQIARRYSVLESPVKGYEWLNYCNPSDMYLSYRKASLEFKLMLQMHNSPFTSSEIEDAYLTTQEMTKYTDDPVHHQNFLLQNYLGFLGWIKQYDKVKSICKEYFDIFGFDFSYEHNCHMF